MAVRPYTALGLQTTHLYVHDRPDVERNLELIRQTLEGVHYMHVEYPIRLVCLAEAAIQTFVDSRDGWDHATNARTGLMSTTVPGPETDFLAELARRHECWLCGQMRARDPELGYEDKYFNILFVIDPQGKLILKYHKVQTFAPEPSVVPHDLWDDYVARYGCTLDSFFPVARTEIGNIGTLECMDTSYPEVARGFAMNGAEILYAPTYIEPYVGRGWHEVQLRARALDNNCYVLAPNSGEWYLQRDSPVPTQLHGGDSMIVDYTGQILCRHRGDGNAYVSAPIDIEALRYWRENASFGSWLKDLRTEQFRPIYEEPIFPKNRFLHSAPGGKPERVRTERDVVADLVRRGKLTHTPRSDD